MLGGFENAHGVHEPVAALLGHYIGEIFVVFQHAQIVTGIVGGNGGVAALHLLKHLVHDLSLIHPVLYGVGDELVSLLNLRFVSGIHRVPQVQQGDAQSIPGVVDKQHVPGVLGIEHGAPAGNGLLHLGGIVDDAQSAPGVGHGVLVLRIVRQILEAVVDLLKIGDVIIIELGQHILFDQLGDHVVGGDDDVIVHAAHAQLGIEDLVALCGLVVDFDAGLFFKLVDQGLVDIFTPAAHVDHTVPAAAAVTAAGIFRVRGVLAHGASGQEQARRHQ